MTEMIEGEVISTELAVREQQTALFAGATPQAVALRMQDTAKALKAIIESAHGSDGKPLVMAIPGVAGRYVRCEGWTTLGGMLGVFPVLCWTRPIDGGWEARVEARTMAGTIIGASEAMCTRSERAWEQRDDYALRSMAQTRATAKALRMPLGFVMTLAGYDATPAEEMPPAARNGSQQRQQGGRIEEREGVDRRPECPQHGALTFIKAGTSKAGKAYSSFWSCRQDCAAGDKGKRYTIDGDAWYAAHRTASDAAQYEPDDVPNE